MKINLTPPRYYRLKLDRTCEFYIRGVAGFRDEEDIWDIEKYRSNVLQKVIDNLRDIKHLKNMEVTDSKLKAFGSHSCMEYIFHIESF